ncbi:MAG TPA: hypothetical protein VMN82_14605 [Thermoanaerobaculia bacterium]|nr:hypothetical protein [Thermoanaerobaculia bacterium]
MNARRCLAGVATTRIGRAEASDGVLSIGSTGAFDPKPAPEAR